MQLRQPIYCMVEAIGCDICAHPMMGPYNPVLKVSSTWVDGVRNCFQKIIFTRISSATRSITSHLARIDICYHNREIAGFVLLKCPKKHGLRHKVASSSYTAFSNSFNYVPNRQSIKFWSINNCWKKFKKLFTDLVSIKREFFSIFYLFSVASSFLNLYEEKVGSYHQIAFKKIVT